ncbi:MAG TPA: hypothetical protein VIY49_00015 [Bryobacteraceae bacterium]
MNLKRIPELNERWAVPELESWNLPDVPLAIECSTVALEEIRSQAWEGFGKLAHRGREIGGILYGTRRREAIRIEAVRPIDCQYAQGPGFVLSQADRAALREQIADSENDRELKKLIPLGWFVSHTRVGIEMTAPDIEIYSTYFPEPWQVTLVVHPRHGATTSGAFFVRRDGGQAKLGFELPNRLGFGAGRAETHRRLKPAPLEHAPLQAAPPEPAPLESAKPAPRRARLVRRRLVWVWLAVWVLAVGGLGWASVRLVQGNPAPQRLGLDLLDKDGQLRIEWNRNVRPVVKAVRGWLYIADGEDSSTVDLNPQDLGRGTFVYERKSGSVEVRLRMENAVRRTEEEASRFLGTAPLKKPDPEELKLSEQQRQALEAEGARLQAEKAVQARRIAELEAAMRVLQARVALAEGRGSVSPATSTNGSDR